MSSTDAGPHPQASTRSDPDRVLEQLPADGSPVPVDAPLQRSGIPMFRAGAALALLCTKGVAFVWSDRGVTYARRGTTEERER